MYYHVIENAQREGKQVYVHTISYRRYGSLERFLKKFGRPCWVLRSLNGTVPVNGQHSQPTLGGFRESYWNAGSGWAGAVMPVLPFFKEER